MRSYRDCGDSDDSVKDQGPACIFVWSMSDQILEVSNVLNDLVYPSLSLFLLKTKVEHDQMNADMWETALTSHFVFCDIPFPSSKPIQR